MGVEEVSDELYGAPPDEFVARRRDHAARAKAAGEKALAAAIAKLTRPTTSAWLVNLLVRQESAGVDELLSVGAALRDAQANLAGEALRELSARRRELLAELVALGARVGAGAGHPVSDSVRREVGETLEAALADPRAAEAVRSGRLTRALSYAGFGPVDLDGSVAVPVPVRPPERAAATATTATGATPASSASGPKATTRPKAVSDPTSAHPNRATRPTPTKAPSASQSGRPTPAARATATAATAAAQRTRQDELRRAASQAVAEAERQAAVRRAERDEHQAVALDARRHLDDLLARITELEAELGLARRERTVAAAAVEVTERRGAESTRTLRRAEQVLSDASAALARLGPPSDSPPNA